MAECNKVAWFVIQTTALRLRTMCLKAKIEHNTMYT